MDVLHATLGNLVTDSAEFEFGTGFHSRADGDVENLLFLDNLAVWVEDLAFYQELLVNTLE